MTNLESMLKSRDITLPTNVCLVIAMVFPVVMYGCESRTIKKAEHQRIDAFELRCWRRLLRVPWTARRSNQSILKEISPGCSLEGLILKLKLPYFGHLMWRVDPLERPWCWEGLGAGGEGDETGWDGWMASLTWWAWVWVSSGSWWWTGRPGVLRFMGSQRVRYDWVTELNWTNSKYNLMCGFKRSFVTISQWMSCTSRRAFSLFCYVTLKDKCRGAVHLYSEKILTKTIILALVSWCQAHLTDNNEHTGSAVS